MKAILVAQGVLKNPLDSTALSLLGEKIGPVDSKQLARARLSVSWGIAKESYAREAFAQALATQLCQHVHHLQETGFMSCAQNGFVTLP